jgi:hypothetical protein
VQASFHYTAQARPTARGILTAATLFLGESMSTVVCWNCGRDLADIPRPISRHSNCPECFSNLHCCRLCKHFLPERVGVCAEDRADPPVEKENANFCSFFLPANSAFDQQSKIKGDAAQNALANLFGAAAAEDSAAEGTSQKSEQPATDTTIDALNALFKPKK